MNKRITLQYPTRTADGMGGFAVVWTDKTVWAKAWTVSSSEGVDAMQTVLTRIQKFGIRYRTDIQASWRVKWGTRYFNIVSIDPDAEDEFLYLTCKETVE